MDETGKQIVVDMMDVLGAGKHFFYLSGARLPAGKYFYQIEFPQGNIIVSRTMMIIK